VTERVIMAGFGGQGMMLLGKLLAQVALNEGLEVTFFPSYGAEVRGGTAHCHVTMSDEPIFSPMIERADSLIVMNQPSYDKFRPRLNPNGRLLLNTPMTRTEPAQEGRSPASCLEIPATLLANELGNLRVANMIMMGAYATLLDILPQETVLRVIEENLGKRKAHLMEANRKAYREGAKRADEFMRSAKAGAGKA